MNDNKKLINAIKREAHQEGYLCALIKALKADMNEEYDKMREESWNAGYQKALLDIEERLSPILAVALDGPKVNGPTEPSER
jgi:alpha-galactosidase